MKHSCPFCCVGWDEAGRLDLLIAGEPQFASRMMADCLAEIVLES